MARGWESKEIESQIEAAAVRTQQARANQMHAANVTLQRERESLELSRTRVLQDMERAENPRYREMLQQSLGFLDQKLAALELSAKPAAKILKHHA